MQKHSNMQLHIEKTRIAENGPENTHDDLRIEDAFHLFLDIYQLPTPNVRHVRSERACGGVSSLCVCVCVSFPRTLSVTWPTPKMARSL